MQEFDTFGSATPASSFRRAEFVPLGVQILPALISIQVVSQFQAPAGTLGGSLGDIRELSDDLTSCSDFLSVGALDERQRLKLTATAKSATAPSGGFSRNLLVTQLMVDSN